ncbi:hypothetical protein HK099_003723 [Clydaea vesicula]|uniref:Uncharacterized protein n=1 Tax=Clydaea vesicula TaxID=447962 RepID=A0AAD5XW50_9FUNG|nr:hypothetical protein HK099_003723 [Clydaea vesicula]
MQSFYNFPNTVENSGELTDEMIETLETLVKKYEWNHQNGSSHIDSNEGYKTFISVIQNNSIPMVKQVLAPYWAVATFNNDIKPYLYKTCDCLLVAVKYKRTEILKMLLEKDEHRWTTADGQKVLKNALQFSVDLNYAEGAKLIKGYYFDSSDSLTKSSEALRKLLYVACDDGDFDSIRLLIYEGAKFEVPYNSEDLMDFSSSCHWMSKLSLCLKLMEIYERKNMHGIINMKLLKKAITHNLTDVIPKVLMAIYRQKVKNPLTGFSALIKLAEKRCVDFFRPNKVVLMLFGYLQLVKIDIRKCANRKFTKAEINLFALMDEKLGENSLKNSIKIKEVLDKVERQYQKDCTEVEGGEELYTNKHGNSVVCSTDRVLRKRKRNNSVNFIENTGSEEEELNNNGDSYEDESEDELEKNEKVEFVKKLKSDKDIKGKGRACSDSENSV